LAKDTKAHRRPSLFVTAFLLSTTLLALVSIGLHQNGLAPLVYGQARASTSTKPKASDQKSRAGQWFVFKSPDGDFTLAFPEKPKLQDVNQGPVTLIRGFGVTTGDGTNFSINFHDIGGDPLARENNEWSRNLEAVLSEADRAQNIQIIQSHRIAPNILEMELLQQVSDMDAQINYLRRSLIHRSRIYTLVCGPVINNKRVDKPLCERFFNSMRFVTQTPRTHK
jgi:hypothetical protein